MTDPYTTLGVPKDADADTIRKAHRNAAKLAHPDAGGNPEEFLRVNGAYMVLRDPVRRKRYDDTGDTAEPKDNAFTELVRLVVSAASSAPEHVDVLDFVGGRMREHIAKLQSQKRETQELAAKLRRQAGRLKRKDDNPNPLATALENQAAAVDREVANILEAVDQHDRMLAMLRDYRFEMPATMHPMQAMMPPGFAHFVYTAR
jgi:curved DNA-binding protein CbpA